MIILKELIKYDNASVLEATWVNVNSEAYESPIIVLDEKGGEVDTGKTETKTREIETVIKCHAYADVQMYTLRADAAEMETPLTQYEALIAEVEANIVPYVAPQPTAEELKAITDAKRAEDMLKGSIYILNGIDYQVSFTKDDGDGMVQAENAFNRTVRNTIIHFCNGTEMPISKDDFSPFADWFVAERNKFFIEA